MHDVSLVAVVHSREYLLCDFCGIDFAKLLLFRDLVEELATVTEFSNEEVSFLVLKELVKFQNVWVI